MVAQGRRTDAVLARHDDSDGPWLLRILHADQDRRAFARELDHASAFEGAARVEGAAEYEGELVAHVRPVVGETLASILGHLFETRTTMPQELAIALVTGIASRFPGSERAHGDLVPQHVLVGYDGYVHLIDPAAPEFLADRGQAPGRAGYRSPEHVAGQEVSSTSDVFSLGVLLFELTTGHRLFEGDDALRAGREILAGEYKRPRSVVESYPIELQVVLRRMLRTSPQDRFSDPATAADALRRTSDRARAAGPALGHWLGQQLPDRRGAWQVALRAAGFSLPSAPPRPPVTGAAPPARAPASRPAPPQSARGTPARAPALTLEALEQADAEGRSLFDSPPLDFGRPSPKEITVPSRVGPAPPPPRAPPQPEPLPPTPEPAPRSDTLIDTSPRLGSEPTAIVSAHVPARSPAEPAAPKAAAPKAAAGAPPRPAPKVSRPPEKPRSKVIDLAADLLDDFGTAPVTDRLPVPGSVPPEMVDSIDLEVQVDLASEATAEVSIPHPRRLQRSPSLDLEAPTAQLDLSVLRVPDDRADTTLDAARTPISQSAAPPRKEATMVVRDRGPKSRPPPGVSPSPPPTPKPSDIPPAPKAPERSQISDDLAHFEPFEPLPGKARTTASPARRKSSVVPLPKRPATEKASMPAPEAAPPERRVERDPTSEIEALVVPVIEEETPARQRRALLFVVLILIGIGAASGVLVARLFPQLIPVALRGKLGPIEGPRPVVVKDKPSDGTVPATTITSSAAGLAEDDGELPPLVPLMPTPGAANPTHPAQAGQIRLNVFPPRTRIVVDGVRITNGSTIALGGAPRSVELKARGCAPYTGVLDESTGPSFDMVLPCKDLSPP